MSEVTLSTPSKGQRTAQQHAHASTTSAAQHNPRVNHNKAARTQQQRPSEPSSTLDRSLSTGDVMATPSRNKQIPHPQSQTARQPRQSKPRENGHTNYASDQGSAGINSYDGAGFSKYSSYNGAPSTPSKNTSATPIKQAYAGPTFHASPAASALPLPRLFAKSSLPLNAATSALRDMTGAESDTGDGSPSKPVKEKTEEEPISREESPLDFFFKAHRAEQNQARMKSPLNPSMSLASTSPCAKPLQIHSSFLDLPQERAHTNHTPSGKHMFMMEMDDVQNGDHEEEIPAVTPFKQKLKDALTPKANSSGLTDEQDRSIKTEALKRLLMLQPSTSQPASRTPTQNPSDVAPQASPQNPPIITFQGHPSAPWQQGGLHDEAQSLQSLGAKPLQSTQGNAQSLDINQLFKPTSATPSQHSTTQSHNTSVPATKPVFQPTSDMAFFSSPSRPPQAQPKAIHPPQYASAPQAHSQSENVRLMEDSLRRVLKLHQ